MEKYTRIIDLQEHYLHVPYYNEDRRIRVLLPEDYEINIKKRYPVLYLHDGQNVFSDEESYSGYSWRIPHIIQERPDLGQMIVVAIDNSEENRLDEYSPWQAENPTIKDAKGLGGDGIKYGKWFVDQIKPLIDKTYRTKTDKDNSILAGSSMGGLITAYMGAQYPHIFGKLGVFSLASWFAEDQFLDLISTHQTQPGNMVYIQVGTKEHDQTDEAFIEEDRRVSQAYIDVSINYYDALIKSGLKTDDIWLRIMVDETHNEYYWAKHFPEFLDFISKNHHI